jgi:DNA-binding NtrC family response regulator
MESFHQNQRRGKVLIADADRDSAREISSTLVTEGFSAVVMGSLRDTFSHIQQEKVDVLILDVHMPEMMGYEAVPIIRGMDPKLPIIITARENTSELESHVRHQKVFYYHVKSFGPNELKLAVRNAFERSQKPG